MSEDMKRKPRNLSRRGFLAGSAAAATFTIVPCHVLGAPVAAPDTKSVLTTLYRSLSEQQRKSVCFGWDHIGHGDVPLRLHVSNNRQVSGPKIGSSFYSAEQKQLIAEVLNSVMSPGWPAKLAQQVEDDGRGEWGSGQSIGIFGTPDQGRMQMTLTGFHLTIKAVFDDDSPVAFGGGIAHGHQPSGFYEKVGHPGNFFWYQALEANKVFQLLDEKQRVRALLTKGMPYYTFDGNIDRSTALPNTEYDPPREHDMRFQPKDKIPGLPIAAMSKEQQAALRQTLQSLLDPYRQAYQDQVFDCLKAQGGLESCNIVFYKEHDMGDDGQWDNWRIEGPSFVWFWRGEPHVHIWIHVANTAKVKVSSNFG